MEKLISLLQEASELGFKPMTSDFWPSALRAVLEAGWNASGNGSSLIVERFVILAHLFFSENYSNQLSSSYVSRKGECSCFPFWGLSL